MITRTCAYCGGKVHAEGDRPLTICPYCAKPFPEEEKVSSSDLEKRLKAMDSPKKKYKLIMEALQNDPDDFEANKALLYHGRLHEPMKGSGVDYSIIKSHLLSVLEYPETYREEILREKYEELLRGPQLLKTMRLAPDAESFFWTYLRRLAFEYIDLFIRGDSRYNRSAFGIFRSNSTIARKCAVPVRRMLQNVKSTPYLDDTQRMILKDAIIDGYHVSFPGAEEQLISDDPPGRDA